MRNYIFILILVSIAILSTYYNISSACPIPWYRIKWLSDWEYTTDTSTDGNAFAKADFVETINLIYPPPVIAKAKSAAFNGATWSFARASVKFERRFQIVLERWTWYEPLWDYYDKWGYPWWKPFYYVPAYIGGKVKGELYASKSNTSSKVESRAGVRTNIIYPPWPPTKPPIDPSDWKLPFPMPWPPEIIEIKKCPPPPPEYPYDIIRWENEEKIHGTPDKSEFKSIDWNIKGKGMLRLYQPYTLYGKLSAISYAKSGIASANFYDTMLLYFNLSPFIIYSPSGKPMISYSPKKTSMGIIYKPHIVPEPCTMLLMGSGLVGLAGLARRRKRS